MYFWNTHLPNSHKAFFRNIKNSRKEAWQMIIKECDLLCIGGGGAGVAAAVTASQKGANVLIVSKEPVGYGNTRIIGGVMAYGDLNEEKIHNR